MAETSSGNSLITSKPIALMSTLNAHLQMYRIISDDSSSEALEKQNSISF